MRTNDTLRRPPAGPYFSFYDGRPSSLPAAPAYLLVDLLLLAQDDAALGLDSGRVKVGVLQNVGEEVDRLGHVLLENLGVVSGLLTRGVRVQVGANVLDLNLETGLRALLGALGGARAAAAPLDWMPRMPACQCARSAQAARRAARDGTHLEGHVLQKVGGAIVLSVLEQGASINPDADRRRLEVAVLGRDTEAVLERRHARLRHVEQRLRVRVRQQAVRPRRRAGQQPRRRPHLSAPHRRGMGRVPDSGQRRGPKRGRNGGPRRDVDRHRARGARSITSRGLEARSPRVSCCTSALDAIFVLSVPARDVHGGGRARGSAHVRARVRGGGAAQDTVS